MKLKKNEFIQFIDIRFGGNITQTAKALDLNASTLSRLVGGKTKEGKKVLESIIKYCKERDMDFEELIEF